MIKAMLGANFDIIKDAAMIQKASRWIMVKIWLANNKKLDNCLISLELNNFRLLNCLFTALNIVYVFQLKANKHGKPIAHCIIVDFPI